jgi:uncharacterized membrane protein YfbV (UPF0208 family)
MGPLPSVHITAIGTVTKSFPRPGIHIIEVTTLKTPSHNKVAAATDPDYEGSVLLKVIGNFLLGEHTSNTIIGDRRISQVFQDILDATCFTIIVVPVVAVTAGIVAAVFITEIMKGSMCSCILRDFTLFYVVSIESQNALTDSSPAPLVLLLLCKWHIKEHGIRESRDQKY